MSHESDHSPCYAMQLQVDSFLDGELRSESEHAFLAHVAGCAECAHELRFAQHLHEAVLDLPSVDCADTLVDSIYSATKPASNSVLVQGGQPPLTTRWRDLVAKLSPPSPLALSLGALALCAVAAALSVGVSVETRSQAPELASVAPAQELAERSVDSEEVRAALTELNTAIEYLNRVSRQTEAMIGERFVVWPLQQNVDSSLRRASFRLNEGLNDGPI